MTSQNGIPPEFESIIAMDRKLRKDVTEYFFALSKLNQPEKAVELLAGHVAIMVEMIKDLKKGK